MFQGPNWYTRETVQYLLDCGHIRLEHIKHTITASRHVEGAHFREVSDALAGAVKQLGARPGLVKEMFNSMIGLWNTPVKTSFSVRRSGCVDDLRRVDVIRSSLGSDEGIADCLVRTKIVSCDTAYPLALVALQKELVTVHRMHRALQGAGVDLRGVHTDGVFFRRGGAART